MMGVRYDKVNFCGAQGTGKTTLMDALCADQQTMDAGFRKIASLTRSLMEAGISINRNGNAESQHLIYEAYAAVLSGPPMYIADRCITDVVAYTSCLYDYATDMVEKMALSKEESYERKDFMSRYPKLCSGLVVYVPIEFPITGDGVRDEDISYQKDVDRKIKQLLDNNRIPYLTVTGSVEERLSQVKRKLFI